MDNKRIVSDPFTHIETILQNVTPAKIGEDTEVEYDLLVVIPHRPGSLFKVETASEASLSYKLKRIYLGFPDHEVIIKKREIKTVHSEVRISLNQ